MKTSPDWILAIGGSEHDLSAALARGCDIRVAIEQERLSRRKHGMAHWYESPVTRSIEYCLADQDIDLRQVTRAVSSDSVPARIHRDLCGLELRQFPHHLCHAAAAAMMLPADSRAGILVYDGYGSIRGPAPESPLRNLRETFSFYTFAPEGYRCLGSTFGLAYIEQDEFPIGVTNSIGMLYELVTGLLGYDLMDSGKTMGLSSYGVPRYLDVLERFVRFGDSPSSCFYCASDDPDLTSIVGGILRNGRGSFAVRADLAASTQMLVHKTLLHCLQFFRELPLDYLCISGGCGLNTVANGFLVQHGSLEVPLLIPPHCGDAGLGLGALWLDQLDELGVSPTFTFNGDPVGPALSRPGRRYSLHERREAVLEFYPKLVFDSSVVSPDDLARVLARGEIIGLFNGRSENGNPRDCNGSSSDIDRTRMPVAAGALLLSHADERVSCISGDCPLTEGATVGRRWSRGALGVVHRLLCFLPSRSRRLSGPTRSHSMGRLWNHPPHPAVVGIRFGIFAISSPDAV